MATTTMSKAYFEDLGRIAQTNAKSAQDSARKATDYWADYWVTSRETNNEVARQIARTITEGTRRQTNANEEFTNKIFEILEERDEDHKRFFEQWAEAFASMPFEHAKQATREAQKVVDDGTTSASANGGFPIAGYEELSVEEITDRLEGLSEAQLKQVRDHERRTKNRKSLMEQIDRKFEKVGS